MTSWITLQVPPETLLDKFGLVNPGKCVAAQEALQINFN
jgi:hypothetical protein